MGLLHLVPEALGSIPFSWQVAEAQEAKFDEAGAFKTSAHFTSTDIPLSRACSYGQDPCEWDGDVHPPLSSGGGTAESRGKGRGYIMLLWGY